MAGTLLFDIVNFTGLVTGVPASLPHGLNVNGTPVVPQYVVPRVGGFSVTVNSTHVTATRLPSSGAVDALDVSVEYRHSIIDVSPDLGPLQPFILSRSDDVGATPAISFVFRPGDVAHENVYTDWPALMAGVDSVEGLKQILFDDSIVSPCVIPAGTWNMRNVVLMGLLFRPTLAQVSEGVIFLELHQFDANILLDFVGATPPIQDLTNGDVVILERGAVLKATGTGPFISQANMGPGAGCIYILRDGARWETGASAVLEVQAGGNAVTGTLGAFSELQSDTVSGGAGGVLQILATANVPLGFASVDQPNFTGTVMMIGNTSRFNIDSVLTADGNANPGYVTRCDPTGGGFNVFLPPAFNNQGQVVIVKNVSASANPITITAQGGDNIDTAPTLPITAAFGRVILFSDGISQWMA